MDVMKKCTFLVFIALLVSGCSEEKYIDIEQDMGYITGNWHCDFQPIDGGRQGAVKSDLLLREDQTFSMKSVVHQFKDNGRRVTINESGRYDTNGVLLVLNAEKSQFDELDLNNPKKADLINMLSKGFYAPKMSTLEVISVTEKKLSFTEDSNESRFVCDRY